MTDDDVLRDALRAHAGDADVAPDPGGLDRRLTAVDRRRTGLRVGSALVVVAAVAAALLVGRGEGTTGVDTATDTDAIAPRPSTTVPTPDTAAPDTAPDTAPSRDVPGGCQVTQERDRSTSTPPVGVYVGTAPPGSVVRVQAADGYGAAQTTVDASGTFRLEVTFVGAPANQPFEVWAGCPATQVKQTFQFTWLG